MILLLAGTAEARALVVGLRGQGALVTASLAGVTDAPADLGVPTRIGGFGGEAGFRAYVARAGVRAVIDATHPFAERIGPRTKVVCADLGLPYLRLLRPGWEAAPGDRWIWVDRPEDVGAALPRPATVLLAIGPRTLPRLGALPGIRAYCRRVDPTEDPFPLADGEWVVGLPGATAQVEAAWMQAHGIDCVVAKDAGGSAGFTKIAAAGLLGLPVVMIRRPPQGQGDTVATVAAARDWVARL